MSNFIGSFTEPIEKLKASWFYILFKFFIFPFHRYIYYLSLLDCLY